MWCVSGSATRALAQAPGRGWLGWQAGFSSGCAQVQFLQQPGSCKRAQPPSAGPCSTRCKVLNGNEGDAPWCVGPSHKRRALLQTDSLHATSHPHENLSRCSDRACMAPRRHGSHVIANARPATKSLAQAGGPTCRHSRWHVPDPCRE
jgi:hypothetical protein